MKRVWQELRRGRGRVAKHPFFEWLTSDSVPLERRFVFSPAMIDFIMGFADLNKWFLSYPNPGNELERAINQHTEEDRTHSQLFYENWYTLTLGELQSWPPGKMLWWLFHSRDAEIVRRFGMDLLALSTKHADPLVRFPMMEAIEICGDIFFGHTAPIAGELTKKHGVAHDYYGKYHRDRETGHLHADETPLLRSVLSEEQRVQASAAVEHVYSMFCSVLDQLLDYCGRAADYPALLADLDREYRDATLPPPAVNGPPSHAPTALPGATQRPAWLHLKTRVAQLEAHPFLAWLADHEDVPARDRLRGFVALWGIDIAGYKDFNELVLGYSEPATELQQSIQSWTENLATHAALYLRDWRALELDSVLGWDAGEAIAFYFLGRETEVHRCNMAKVKHHAFSSDDPLLRFWLITALESSGQVLLRATAPLAAQVENQEGVTLDYWGNRHHLAHATGAIEARDVESLFLQQSLTAEQSERACRIIDTVFDNMAEQFALSLDVASKQSCVNDSRSMPPPRTSVVVARASYAAEEAQAV